MVQVLFLYNCGELRRYDTKKAIGFHVGIWWHSKQRRLVAFLQSIAEIDATTDLVNSDLSHDSAWETARRLSARAVNSIMTATYWEVGRRIVELEQDGEGRAPYGQELLPRLATDLTERFGRGFSRANLEYMRRFFELWRIPQTPSGISLRPRAIEEAWAHPLAHFVLLIFFRKGTYLAGLGKNNPISSQDNDDDDDNEEK